MTSKIDSFNSRHTKHISLPYSHIYIVLKVYKNKNQWCSFKATADAADKGKFSSIRRTPEVSDKSFCDGLEMKFTSLFWKK